MKSAFEILVVEDCEDQVKVLRRVLADYQVKFVGSAEEASCVLNESGGRFDLILMDINLPARNGYSLLGEIQSNSKLRETQVFCVSGRSEITDKLTAFSLGADDYIAKPFDPLELRARVDSRLKKRLRDKDESGCVSVGGLRIDLVRHLVTLQQGGQQHLVNLSQTEFKILLCLARRPEVIFSRDQLLSAVWGENLTVVDRVVDTHICTLRKKLGAYSGCIKSVPGFGYKMVELSDLVIV